MVNVPICLLIHLVPKLLVNHDCDISNAVLSEAAPVTEWLKMLICTVLNPSSHCCGFKPSSGHM